MSVADEIRERVERRLAELEPAIQEYRELLAIKEGLDAARHGPDQPVKPPAVRGPAKRPGRRDGSRAEQAIRIVGRKPGVTVNEIAAEMGINQNYLYRLLPRMEREGQLRREGKGWALASS